VADDRVIYSASDLAAAARCEYALLRAFDAKLGRGPAVAVEDELLARTAELGGEHEQRHLDILRATADVAVIGRPAYTVAGLTAAAEATMRAVERRAPVVYQAAMFDGRFAGFADFLVLEGDQYRLRDTKLARSVKVEALLQLAAYAGTLATAGVPVASEVELVLGDGAAVSYPVGELLPVYRPRRAALQRLLDDHLASGQPVAWEDESVRACFRCPECTLQVPRPRRPSACGGHAAESAGPAHRRGHHHHHRSRAPQRRCARTVCAHRRIADLAGAPADRTARRRQAALRGGRCAAADGAARCEQG